MMKLTTIDQMEVKAQENTLGSYSKKIRGEWLEVALTEKNGFRYQWGENDVSREVAANILFTEG